MNQDGEECFIEWSGAGGGIDGSGSVGGALFLASEELSSTIGVAVEVLGSSVLVAINMLVMSAYSDSESVEVPTEFVDRGRWVGLRWV